jgi:hypothetical protein
MAEQDSLKIEQRVNKAVFDPGSSAGSSDVEDTVADSHLAKLDALLNPGSTTSGGPPISEFETGGAMPDSGELSRQLDAEGAGGRFSDAAVSDVAYAPGSSGSQRADSDARFSGFETGGAMPDSGELSRQLDAEGAGGRFSDSTALSDVAYAPGSSGSQLADIDAQFSGFDNAGPSEAAARLAEVNESFAGSDTAAADETPAASPEDNWA